MAAILPASLNNRFNFRVGAVLHGLPRRCARCWRFVLGVVYMQESLHAPAEALRMPFIKVFSLLAVLAAVCAWWVVLANESRRMAHDESERQTQLLQKEIDAHQRTDEALQSAKEVAESASQAKTRYVAGMTHELRTPLNSILGYAQILLRNSEVQGSAARGGHHHPAKRPAHACADRRPAGPGAHRGRPPAPGPGAAAASPEFLSELARMVQPQAEGKGLRFRLETQGRVPAWVQADAKRLRQILINLLANAVRFTDHGGIVLSRGLPARGDALRGGGHRHRHCAAGPGAHLPALRARQRRAGAPANPAPAWA